jgi:hypothetical protein
MVIWELSDGTFVRLYFNTNGEVHCSRKENMSFMDKFIREHDSYVVYQKNGKIDVPTPDWYDSDIPLNESPPQILEQGEVPQIRGKRGRPKTNKRPTKAVLESCSQHPTYHGLRKPHIPCEECLALYDKKQGEKHGK